MPTNPVSRPQPSFTPMAAPSLNPEPRTTVTLAARNTRIADVAPDPFWYTAIPDELRWDESYPFQLMILDYMGEDRYSRALGVGNTFTLPIPPQEYRKGMPFAFDGGVTQGGYAETGNGVPLRTISLRGTTGVLPGRPSGETLASANIAQSIFAGTVGAAENLVAVATAAGSRPNQISDADLKSSLKGTTGYLQFLLLQDFLEKYAIQKKDSQYRFRRLAFADWKTQEVYIVTPLSFDLDRSAASPLEFMWSLSMKAFRRIQLDKPEKTIAVNTPVTRDPGAMQQMLTKIREIRTGISRLADVVSATGQDVNSVLFEPLRQIALFVKDALGLSVTVCDLPVSIIRDMKGAILQLASVPDAATAAGLQIGANFQQAADDLQELALLFGTSDFHDGVPVGTGNSLQNVNSSPTRSNPHPGNTILENPGPKFFELFDRIQVGSLNLPPAVRRKISDERTAVRKLGRQDFETMRDNVEALSAAFAETVGAGSATYNRVHNKPTVVTTRTPTDADFDVMFALNQAVLEMSRLAVSGEIGDRNKLTVMEYVAGLAGQSGIPFRVPASKFLVPMPYGSTLEQVATRYLGSPDRWQEIATLNRLQEPYVDEIGFIRTLLTNLSGNTAVISTAENLFVGQSVWFENNSVPRVKRHIAKIVVVGPGQVMVTVDGTATDLVPFTTASGAQLHAFQPNSVNSQMLIFIPSDEVAPDEDFRNKPIPGLDLFDIWLQQGGVDVLLTPDGDAAITSDGDWRLAVGLTNLTQWVRTFIATPRGSLNRHPGFGIGIEAGTSTADVKPSEILASAQDMMRFNPAFVGVHSASVQKSGPAMNVNVVMDVAGTNYKLPVTVGVRQ